MEELDSVALTVDLPEVGLKAGDRGVIVSVLGEHEEYYVEFMTFGGETVALEFLAPKQIRQIQPDDIPSVREVGDLIALA